MHQCPVDNINVVFKNQDFQTSDGVLMGNVLIALHCKQTFFLFIHMKQTLFKDEMYMKKKTLAVAFNLLFSISKMYYQ